MRPYKHIRAEIARLEREAEAARKSEAAAVVSKIKAMAREYDLTVADIGLDGVGQQERSGSSDRSSAKAAPKKAAKKAAAKKAARSGAGVAKYRDPKSGQTWSGFGRAPQWLASAKKREDFLIGSGDAQANAGAPAAKQSTAATTRSRPVSKAARKASAKTPTAKAVPPGKAARRPAAKTPAASAADAGEAPVSTQ